MSDLISRQAAIDAIEPTLKSILQGNSFKAINVMDKIRNLPSAQPFNNTTLSEVLAYIDGMSEDEWQEFVACLECRGWYLVRRVAKWCGGEFA